ncbi:4-diphosphocytidyl-2-C-methyl-D-erythritol kinase [Spiroplasma clarkii]|nr:hypothetical protein [Spiroplasma clarkii]ARU90882.1 4-diphosphocytidyl-2-C-methyl-D-erythritol kinase [Spiroplasma clarkii]
MKIKAYAKVNLNLFVEPLDSNGLHKINSTMTLVQDFYDIIKIKKSKIDRDSIISNSSLLEKSNFIFEVLDLLRSEGEIDGFYKIKLKKNLPIGSGLGGGTADAIAVYLGLVKNRNKQLDQKVAAKIGYDSYFF